MTLYGQICLCIDIFRWSVFILSGFLVWRFILRPAWEKYKDLTGW